MSCDVNLLLQWNERTNINEQQQIWRKKLESLKIHKSGPRGPISKFFSVLWPWGHGDQSNTLQIIVLNMKIDNWSNWSKSNILTLLRQQTFLNCKLVLQWNNFLKKKLFTCTVQVSMISLIVMFVLRVPDLWAVSVNTCHKSS